MEYQLVKHSSSLPDPRVLLKTDHKLIDIIVITLCEVLAGADDGVEISVFGEAKEDWFKTFPKLPNGIPAHDTFGRVFARIEPEEFGKCLASWICEVFPSTCFDVNAIDAKTPMHCHDRANGKSAIHMVNAWAVGNRLVLGQVKTDDKSNEIAAPELLKVIDVKGSVAIDAMGCQKEIAKQIVEQRGDYVLALKGNQGILHKEVELLFQKGKEDNYKDLAHDCHTTVDGEHGRTGTHAYTTIADVGWFEEKGKWGKLTTFAMVESERNMGDSVTKDTRYFISSLPNDAWRFCETSRARWGVENSIHWCHDIAFREDDSRVRKGHGAANLAIVGRFAFSLIKQDPLRKVGVKASRKRAGWDNSYLLHLSKV